MKKQDTEAKLKKALEQLETVRKEKRNLKRQVKRLKESKKAMTDERKSSSSGRSEEVQAAAIGDIKKKLQAEGMEGKTLEVAEWFMSNITGSPKK